MNEQQETLYVADVDMPSKTIIEFPNFTIDASEPFVMDSALCGMSANIHHFRTIQERIAELQQNPERKAALDKAKERLDHIADADKMIEPSDYDKEFWGDNHSGEATDMVQEPVAWKDTLHTDDNSLITKEPMLLGYDGWEDLPDGTDLYTTPQTTPNLNCKSVQRRLATSWGYVRKEEYGMAKVAAARQMRDAAVKLVDDTPFTNWFRGDLKQAIAALPLPGEER